jgi:hypothetical protein
MIIFRNHQGNTNNPIPLSNTKKKKLRNKTAVGRCPRQQPIALSDCILLACGTLTFIGIFWILILIACRFQQ